jgi:hypothetical protein
MNPVLLQVIRQVYYSSTASMATQTFKLFSRYPSLHNNNVVRNYTWRDSIPLNAFVMGAVAVRRSIAM